MKKTLFVLIVGLTVLSSCKFDRQLTKLEKEILEQIAKRNNYIIPDSLFAFFPDESNKYKYLKAIRQGGNSLRADTSFRRETFSNSHIIEIYYCEHIDSLQQLINEYRSQSIFSVKSEDTDYFVTYSNIELYSREDSLQLKEKYLQVNEKVIVFFQGPYNHNMHAVYNSSTISGLQKGYEIVVLKSGNNFVLPQNYLYDWSILPENLKHGYRSGVAFKEGESYIIYWTVAW